MALPLNVSALLFSISHVLRSDLSPICFPSCAHPQYFSLPTVHLINEKTYSTLFLQTLSSYLVLSPWVPSYRMYHNLDET